MNCKRKANDSVENWKGSKLEVVIIFRILDPLFGEAVFKHHDHSSDDSNVSQDGSVAKFIRNLVGISVPEKLDISDPH